MKLLSMGIDPEAVATAAKSRAMTSGVSIAAVAAAVAAADIKVEDDLFNDT